MKKLWKPLLGLVVVLAAFTVSFGWPRENGLQIDIDTSPRARAAGQMQPWDLTKLRVMNRAILEINESYVDPTRVDYQRMMLASLNAVQRSVAPVLVDYDDSAKRMIVQVNSARQDFPIADVDSPWELAGRFRNVFAFLQEHLKDEADLELREVEYAAVNGMLRTLDPHTVLLTPEIFEEMQTSTRGEFGGLGIVISIRDGHLTVIKPMPGTPAFEAGLKRHDRIVKIEDESTLNMPLSEAVERLRGTPGSKVAIYITRKNEKTDKWSAPRKVELTRAVIHIDSVEHRMLKKSIGYVEINNFQGNTYDDLRKALAELHESEMKGLVLDLRSNPGGLLDQAVRVADAFLTGGPIVTTSSQDPQQREEKFARRGGTEPDYPMVVLINGASASASEIVAGALKNHDRALIVGEQSFGKGSVQVLYNFQDGSALKLTVAQYLTPGDISIQGVGIVPDIAIAPMTVDRDDMDLKVDETFIRESDLRSHLTHESASDTQLPSVVMGYYLDNELRQRLREAEPEEEENEDEEAFLISFARDLVAGAQSANREQMLEDAGPIIAEVEKEETAKVVKELKALGVDWTVGPDEGTSAVTAVATTSAGKRPAVAGDSLSLTVKVTNTGSHTLYQLRGLTRSDNRLFDERELVFGKLAPGETRSWSTTLGICRTEEEERQCRIPRDTIDRADGIRIDFEEAHGHAPEPIEVRTAISALPSPRFAYSTQIEDNIRGNGDGKIQPGEEATVYLQVKNLGPGRTYDVQANMRVLGGRGVLLRDGRFQSKEIKPGEEWVVPFTFQVLPDFEGEEAKLELGLIDTDLNVSMGERITVPVSSQDSTVVTANTKRVVEIKKGKPMLAAPEAGAPAIAHVAADARFTSTATVNGFERIDLGDRRSAWVRSSDVTVVKGKVDAKPPVELAFNKSAPQIEIEVDQSYVTRNDAFRIRGKVTDADKVRDLYIFSGGRKVFYESNEDSATPRSLVFDSEVPLQPGLNTIVVVSREDDDSSARRAFVVRRDAEDGSLLETPKFDDELFGNGH
jgi:carboxyl-terminal processing protease